MVKKSGADRLLDFLSMVIGAGVLGWGLIKWTNASGWVPGLPNYGGGFHAFEFLLGAFLVVFGLVATLWGLRNWFQEAAHEEAETESEPESSINSKQFEESSEAEERAEGDRQSESGLHKSAKTTRVPTTGPVDAPDPGNLQNSKSSSGSLPEPITPGPTDMLNFLAVLLFLFGVVSGLVVMAEYGEQEVTTTDAFGNLETEEQSNPWAYVVGLGLIGQGCLGASFLAVFAAISENTAHVREEVARLRDAVDEG